MNKSSEFEHGISSTTSTGKWDVVFDYNSNAWYNYPDIESLIENRDDLIAIIKDFESNQVPRLSVLASYASGRNHGILNRPNRLEETKSDRRTRHDYGGFISMFNTGYLFGIPVKTETDDEEEQAEIDRINSINETDALNADLGYDCSRFGRAFELHYRNKFDEDKIVLSSVFDTFCIYSSDVEHERIGAIRLVRYKRDNNEVVQVDLYTKNKIIKFKESSFSSLELQIEKEIDHNYGRVPILEWYNNRFRQGDYETVISQIDLYDSAQSDTANYMSDLNDAMLVIKGSMKEADLSISELKHMKDANIMMLEYGIDTDGRPLPLDAGYIYKQYDVAGTEAYKTRLQEDIHKFSYTPDFTDKNFGANASGVAMKYKMIGTEQVRSMKERSFSKAIRERYELIDSLHNALSEQRIDASAITIEFTENMPVDYWADIQAYMTAGGELSQKTLLGQLAWVGSADEEIKRINNERSGAVHDLAFVEDNE